MSRRRRRRWRLGRRGWIGIGVAVVAWAAAGHLLGSRPEAVEADAPVAPCPGDPNCARLRVPVAAPPEAVVAAVHAALGRVRGLTIGSPETVVPTASGALATFAVGPFQDDVAVEVEAGSRGAVLWVRSASRTGRGDLGVNRRRAHRIVEAVGEWLPPGSVDR